MEAESDEQAPAPKAEKSEPAEKEEAPAPEVKSTETPEAPAASEPAEQAAPADGSETPEAPADVNGPADGEEAGGEEPAAEEASGDGTEAGEPAVTDEPEADDQEEDEDEDEYPAVTLSKTVGGVTVTLDAPKGALPKGAKLKVTMITAEKYFTAVAEQLSSEGKVLTDAVAFDVTPIDENGKEIQPKKEVTVTFKNTNLDVAEGGSVDVFRVSDSATTVTEMGTSVATSDKQTFDTDHFTIYVSGASASDPNGDGSGANSTSNRYVLEYGESVTLQSNQGSVISNWRVSAGGNYVTLNGTAVKNQNTTAQDQNVTITHIYTNYYFDLLHYEYFYITLKPQKFEVTFMLQDAGESSFSQYGEPVKVYKGSSVPADQIPTMESPKESGGVEYTFYGWCSDEGMQNDAVFTNVQTT